jgi:hypothetical protein
MGRVPEYPRAPSWGRTLGLTLAVVMVSLARGPVGFGADPPKALAPPVEDGPFLVPAPGEASEPIWGIKGGIAVGLWPTGGPRGLLRVYAPYLGQPRLRMINYIAVEPIVGKARGLSELERSDLDRVAGKAMWSGGEWEDDPRPRLPWQPARGKIRVVGGSKELTVFVFVEPFRNGARPVVQVVLREDRPREVGLRVFAAGGGASMRACVLTATMGNYARLRRLWLADRVVEARSLWPDFRPDRAGFAPPRQWGLDRLCRVGGEVVVAAEPDEAEPAKATYAADVPPWWRYEGRFATQYWRAEPQEGLVARVNGRRTYWATRAEIPGGVAFENFELEAPFRPGQEFVFGVVPGGSRQLFP